VVLLIVFFACGFKLYSSALASLLSILVNYFQILFSKRRRILQKIWKLQEAWKLDYLKEIFPLQWKIALSWVSGYFIFQLFNPVLFATEGPKIAGQMGMTLQALNGISSISMSWITTKVPFFSALIARKEYLALDNIFNKTVKQVFYITTLLTIIFIGVVFGMKLLRMDLGDRFLGISYITLLGITIIINQIVFAWATYLRCHKKEPFLYMSIVVGILCCSSTFFMGHQFGINGIIYGYTFLMISVSFFWSLYIFNKKKLEWHGNI
jgi:O-antigen/teichoic acid export membrane protein